MVGTRGGIGRIAAMVAALAVMLVLAAAEAARAGTYEVAQCGWGFGVELDSALPKTEGTAAYLHPGWCAAAPTGVAPGLHLELGFGGDGDQGVARARWAAPPGTNFTAARLTWASALAAGVWQVAGFDDGSEFHAFAGAGASTAARQVEGRPAGPAPAVEVRLECLLLGPRVGCDRSVPSELLLIAATLTVDDPTPPRTQLGGALVAPGWHRGTVPVEVGAEDPVGSGVARVEATVDGAPVVATPSSCALATIEGIVRATRLRPCPPTAAGAAQVDTTRLGDGVHTVRGCATDLGGGVGCAPEVRVAVDDSPPEVDFAAAPEGRIAATVSDPYSGPASGTIAMRRADADAWTDLPTTFAPGGAGTATISAPLPDLSAGAYVFRASGVDAVGNAGAAQLRAAGSPEALRRQIAAGEGGAGAGPARPVPRGGHGVAAAHGRAAKLVARLVEVGGKASGPRALAAPLNRSLAREAPPDLADRGPRAGRAGSPLTVDFGATVELRGRLVDAHGRGIPRRRVTVVVHPSRGAGRPPTYRRLRTDAAGRFALRLPGGTSRHVAVSFHGGGGFAPARGPELSLRVRAAVSLTAEPPSLGTGESVTLGGQVRPGAARLPARGKLVTIQYLERASHRWRPALVVRTDSRGHFVTHYRFRYVTGEARIRLRATALPEAGWPYAEGSSPPVTVTVRG